MRIGEESGPPDAPTTTLLGNLSQFCATFYHANSWEADVKLCLHWPVDEQGEKLPYRDLSIEVRDAIRKCSKSQVAVVVQLVRTTAIKKAGEEEHERAEGAVEVEAEAEAKVEAESTAGQVLYVARYANCFRGNTDVNLHAEEFLLADEKLAEAIDTAIDTPSTDESTGTGESVDGSAGSLQIRLYMTYQPCHHSGGRVPRDALARAAYAEAMPAHSTTCSERLRDWYTSTLRPRDVGMELVLADVYKATWDEELHPSEVERKVYSNKSEAAREGMRMLLAEGVTMRAMGDTDWDVLVALCDPSVRDAYQQRGEADSPFTSHHTKLRARMDEYLAEYIHDWSVDQPADLLTAEGRVARGWSTSRRLVKLGLQPVPTSVQVHLAPGTSGQVVTSLAVHPARVAAAVSVVARFYGGRRDVTPTVESRTAPTFFAGSTASAAAALGELEDMGLRYAKGPDGTRGFARGRGRALKPTADGAANAGTA